MAIDMSRLPNQTLLAFMAGKTDLNRVNSLDILMAYASGLLSGSERPINALNTKYSTHIGTGHHATLLMLQLGFTYSVNDQLFFPIPSESRESNLRLAMEELSFRNVELRRKLGAPLKPDALEFVDGTQPMTFLFGYDPADVNPTLFLGAKSKIESAVKLGCMHTNPDQLVIECFNVQVQEDFPGRSWYLNAMIQLSFEKKSPVLDEAAALELSKEPHQLVDPSLDKAYRVFNLSRSDEVSDDVLISLYQATYAENPWEVDTFRDALKKIAEERGSNVLTQFLEEGVIPPSSTSGPEPIFIKDEERFE
ncbi:hypothetical protein HDU67_010285 [Dinochytrium kinnereticum]|nr:hypothetical protein HDU67_010285 [Dinochytrium kinnereticum]